MCLVVQSKSLRENDRLEAVAPAAADEAHLWLPPAPDRERFSLATTRGSGSGRREAGTREPQDVESACVPGCDSTSLPCGSACSGAETELAVDVQEGHEEVVGSRSGMAECDCGGSAISSAVCTRVLLTFMLQ